MLQSTDNSIATKHIRRKVSWKAITNNLCNHSGFNEENVGNEWRNQKKSESDWLFTIQQFYYWRRTQAQHSGTIYFLLRNTSMVGRKNMSLHSSFPVNEETLPRFIAISPYQYLRDRLLQLRGRYNHFFDCCEMYWCSLHFFKLSMEKWTRECGVISNTLNPYMLQNRGESMQSFDAIAAKFDGMHDEIVKMPPLNSASALEVWVLFFILLLFFLLLSVWG